MSDSDRSYTDQGSAADDEGEEVPVKKARKLGKTPAHKSTSTKNTRSRGASKQPMLIDKGATEKETESEAGPMQKQRLSTPPSTSPSVVKTTVNKHANKRQKTSNSHTDRAFPTTEASGGIPATVASHNRKIVEDGPKSHSTDADNDNSPASNPDHPKFLLESYAAVDINKELDAIWTLIQSLTQAIFKATKADPQATGAVAVRPSRELEVLYEKLFGGEKWAKRIHRIQNSQTANARDLLSACIAAGVFDVFEQPMPWAEASEEVKLLGPTARFADKVLRASGKSFTMEALLGQAIQRKVKDSHFQETFIRSQATKHATVLNLSLRGQLQAVGTTFPIDKADVDTFSNDWDTRMITIFTKALTLKSKMLAARDKYETERWIESGESFDDAEMEEVHEAARGTREVAWCVSPLVKIQQLEGGSLEVACKAKVFTRRTTKSRK